MSETTTGTTGTTGTEQGSTEQTGQEPGTEQQPAGTEQQQTTQEPDTGDKQVKDLRNEAARYRTERNALQQQVADAQTAQQAMLDNIAKALGLKAEEGADPATQVTELTGTVETLTERNKQLEAELLVHSLAGTPELNANAAALLDSRTFANTLHGLDPSAEDYRDQVAAAIKTAVENTPTLRNGQVPSAGGADNAGQGAGGTDSVTQEQFDAMSYKDRTELFQKDPALYRRLNGG